MADSYQSRLAAMESWYRDLLGSGEAGAELLRDYAPHADWLGKLRGAVLDVGGGAGIVARFLQPTVAYAVADPSEIWAAPEWQDFAARFRAGGPEPRFVIAVGESLPFADGAFDAAIAFWSLNHAHEPRQCVREMARVLRPGGVARIVIDDMEPSWTELIGDGARRVRARLSGRSYRAKIPKPLLAALAAKLKRDWPIHGDHIRLRSSDVIRSSDALHLHSRQWIGGSLCFDLVKRQTRPARKGA